MQNNQPSIPTSDQPAAEMPPKQPRASGLTLRLWPEVTAFFLILMEITWVAPVYRALAGAAFISAAVPTYLVFAGVMLVAYAAARASEVLRLLERLQQVILLSLFAITLLLSAYWLLDLSDASLFSALLTLDQGTFLLFFTVVWLWWRAVRLARGLIEPKTAWNRFWIGLLMLVAYYTVLLPFANLEGNLGIFILFLITGLLALVSARVSYISLYHGATRNPFTRGWLGIIALSVGGVVSVTALLASLMTGQFDNLWDLLTTVLHYLWVAIFFIVTLPWVILAYLIEPLMPFFRDMLAESMQAATSTPMPSAEEVFGNPGPAEMPFRVEVSPFWISLIFWVLFIVLLVIFFSRSRRKLRVRRAGFVEAESLLDEDEDLLSHLRKAARDQMDELANSLARFRPGRRRLAARVREIYAQLMELSDDLKTPRPEAKTPLEFLPALEYLFPNQRGELQTITDAYVKVRYGELPESQAQVAEVEAAWRRLSAEGEQRKKELKARIQQEMREARDRNRRR